MRNETSYFHGTNSESAKELAAGRVCTESGGGELGRGFYTALECWVVVRWAESKFRKEARFVEFSVKDDDFDGLSWEYLSRAEAVRTRRHIKVKNETRDYLFGEDVVLSPIVGGSERLVGQDQAKWESKQAEDLLNGQTVSRQAKKP